MQNLYRIKWGNQLEYNYAFGSTIKFSKDSVIYENTMQSPGSLIHTWNSRGGRIDLHIYPTLPILVPGNDYLLKLRFNEHPENSIAVKIEFFDTELVPVDEKYIVGKEVKFTYPSNASHYKINLVNLNNTNLEFFNFWLIPMTLEEKWNNSVNISDNKNISDISISNTESLPVVVTVLQGTPQVVNIPIFEQKNNRILIIETDLSDANVRKNVLSYMQKHFVGKNYQINYFGLKNFPINLSEEII